jgi:hypothetical protein
LTEPRGAVAVVKYSDGAITLRGRNQPRHRNVALVDFPYGPLCGIDKGERRRNEHKM